MVFMVSCFFISPIVLLLFDMVLPFPPLLRLKLGPNRSSKVLEDTLGLLFALFAVVAPGGGIFPLLPEKEIL